LECRLKHKKEKTASTGQLGIDNFPVYGLPACLLGMDDLSVNYLKAKAEATHQRNIEGVGK
jgi:hypothetical protein